MLKKILFSLLLFLNLSSFCQVQPAMQPTPLENGKASLKQQHTYIMDNSRTYVNNKVIKIEWIEKFYKNSIDSLKLIQSESTKFKKAYNDEKAKAELASESLSNKEIELAAAQSEKDNILLFGSPTTKSSYKSIVWGIIIVLAILLSFFLYKFKSSNSTTKEVKTRLTELEEELTETKKKARLKEQELMRKLQDEINKHL